MMTNDEMMTDTDSIGQTPNLLDRYLVHIIFTVQAAMLLRSLES